MGRDCIVHCVGITKSNRAYTAMNRLEKQQVEYRAALEHDPIVVWCAQTKTGQRILAAKPLRTITCPICKGNGRNGEFFCTPCNGSGITTKNELKRYLPWQLEEMQEDANRNTMRSVRK